MKGTEGSERIFDHQRVQRMDVIAYRDRSAAHGAQILLPHDARALREPRDQRPKHPHDGQHDRPQRPFERLCEQITVSAVDAQRVDGAVLFIHIGGKKSLLFQRCLAGAQFFCHIVLRFVPVFCYTIYIIPQRQKICNEPHADRQKMRLQGVHFIEREQECRDKIVHKIAQAGQIARAQILLDRLLRLFELGVSPLEFL